MTAKKKLGVLIVVLIVAVLAVPLINLVVTTPAPSLAAVNTGDLAMDHVARIMAEKCGSCHTRDNQLPWYSKLPLASSLIEADVRTGLDYMDFAKELAGSGTPVGEVTLAKTERVIAQGMMPPMRYVALHWNSALSDEDQAAIAAWIKATRAARYAVAGTADAFAAEPIQPLPDAVPFDASKAALGKALFHDVRLSKDDSISCASCHDLAKGGTDQAQYSTGVGGSKGGINSPTVYNAVFHVRQFWDGRAADLVEQADGPVNNPGEMASNWDDAARKLSEDAVFTTAFKGVYPEGYSKETCTDAIAEFEKTLVTPNSRFDLYLRGKDEALTSEEKAGYVAFKEVGCATCHVGKAVGGQSFERMGRKNDYFGHRGTLTDADNGRFNFTKNEADRHKFRTPTLRNIAETYPYFHDGSTSDLAEAVDTMANVMLGTTLSESDTVRIVAFLKTLTGQYQGKSVAEYGQG